jgi:hypothetical protein
MHLTCDLEMVSSNIGSEPTVPRKCCVLYISVYKPGVRKLCIRGTRVEQILFFYLFYFMMLYFCYVFSFSRHTFTSTLE